MRQARQKVSGTTSGKDLWDAATESNPGATAAAMQIFSLPEDQGPVILAHLIDMNIRGPQLAYAWQECCGRDLFVLAVKVRDRDPEMVAEINAFFKGDIPYKAVERGAATAAKIPTFD